MNTAKSYDSYKVPSKKKADIRFQLHEIVSRIMVDPEFDTKEEYTKRQFLLDLLTDDKATDAQVKSALNALHPRVTKCHKVPLMNGNSSNHVDGVTLLRHKKHDSVKFGGLFHCGSNWICPICSSNISRVRCEEITSAFHIWQTEGKTKNKLYSQVMVSYTIPHHYDQSLNDLRHDFMKTRSVMSAQKKLRRNPTFKPWNELKKKYGIQGTISAIEVTYGYNGWHPHSHDILFLDRDLSKDDLEELRGYLTTAWIYACKRVKVKMDMNQQTAMYSHAVKVSKAKTAEEYISKFGLIDFEKHKDILNPGWGPAQELTKSHIKQSRGQDGFTPWDFLRIIHQFPDDRDIYLKFGRLFREYSRAFSAKQQIFWSKCFKQEMNSLYIIRPYGIRANWQWISEVWS